MPNENIRQEGDEGKILSGFGQGLAACLKEFSLKQEELAEISGVSQGTLSKILSLKHEPGDVVKKKISEAIGLSIDAIVERGMSANKAKHEDEIVSFSIRSAPAGDGVRYSRKRKEEAPVANDNKVNASSWKWKWPWSERSQHVLEILEESGYSEVPIREASGSMGPGSLESSKKVRGTLAFRTDWLRSKGPVEYMSIIRALGDSMHPTIPDRSMVLIDESRTRVVNNKIYFLRHDDELYIKRVKCEHRRVFEEDDENVFEDLTIYTLISDRDLSEEVVFVEHSDIDIIGECVWVCHDLA